MPPQFRVNVVGFEKKHPPVGVPWVKINPCHQGSTYPMNCLFHALTRLSLSAMDIAKNLDLLILMKVPDCEKLAWPCANWASLRFAEALQIRS